MEYIARGTPYLSQYLYYGTMFTSNAEITLAGNATVYLQGKTGSDRLIHFVNTKFSHNGTDVTWTIYENPTFTADGTVAISAVNNNRLSTTTAQFTAYTDPPNPTSDGTLLTKDRIFAATGGVGLSTSAAAGVSGREFMFKRDTDYALKVTNNVTAATTFVAEWQWFESGN